MVELIRLNRAAPSIKVFDHGIYLCDGRGLQRIDIFNKNTSFIMEMEECTQVAFRSHKTFTRIDGQIELGLLLQHVELVFL